MARYSRISSEEAQRIEKLRSQLGARQLRTLLGEEKKRMMRPERIERLSSGRGKLSDRERKTLLQIEKNSVNIRNLTKRGNARDIQEFKTNRAIRTWLLHGKEKDAKRRKDDDELRAIRALRLLGVDVDLGTFYIKGVTS